MNPDPYEKQLNLRFVIFCRLMSLLGISARKTLTSAHISRLTLTCLCGDWISEFPTGPSLRLGAARNPTGRRIPGNRPQCGRPPQPNFCDLEIRHHFRRQKETGSRHLENTTTAAQPSLPPSLNCQQSLTHAQRVSQDGGHHKSNQCEDSLQPIHGLHLLNAYVRFLPFSQVFGVRFSDILPGVSGDAHDKCLRCTKLEGMHLQMGSRITSTSSIIYRGQQLAYTSHRWGSSSSSR